MYFTCCFDSGYQISCEFSASVPRPGPFNLIFQFSYLSVLILLLCLGCLDNHPTPTPLEPGLVLPFFLYRETVDHSSSMYCFHSVLGILQGTGNEKNNKMQPLPLWDTQSIGED